MKQIQHIFKIVGIIAFVILMASCGDTYETQKYGKDPITITIDGISIEDANPIVVNVPSEGASLTIYASAKEIQPSITNLWTNTGDENPIPIDLDATTKIDYDWIKGSYFREATHLVTEMEIYQNSTVKERTINIIFNNIDSNKHLKLVQSANPK